MEAAIEPNHLPAPPLFKPAFFHFARSFDLDVHDAEQ
jgi:hypothetical protein